MVIVVTNQPVVARGECAPDASRLIHNKIEARLGREHARIDAHYFCLHHPDKGFAGEVPELEVGCAWHFDPLLMQPAQWQRSPPELPMAT